MKFDIYTYTHTQTSSPSIVLFNTCRVLFSYACILFGQGFICRYVFMSMYIFVPSFREAKFCSVPSCVFLKLGCSAGVKGLQNTAIETGKFSPVQNGQIL
jgi:hypothetical protein